MLMAANENPANTTKLNQVNRVMAFPCLDEMIHTYLE
jgi:hypothetical protein